ncbi:TonB-dependent receptor domain-containing protein [Subsaximicrobium wynnwilliamsii]|uniref:TonB-dependent receptor domain-containing protein n=1 Tax=Subsaximicrobium wynnwilliamsii TaxID=291179 RepID=UPI001CB8FE56|nr:outer membrane beta-barrel family protein [Subsaximicrobium wynnwilliamsii]
MKTYFLFLTLSATLFCFSQEYSISGTVLDTNGQPIEFANVFLVSEDAETVIKGISTDDKGFFMLKNLPKNTYILKASFIGFDGHQETIVLTEDLKLEPIMLQESSENLDQVSITVKKPSLIREADRLIFNVQNTALVEGSMLDVLKNTPGVLVVDDAITIKSATPTIYINDKQVYLSSADLNQLLDGSSANSVTSVEVITNPSARYDAASGVVLNIKMSKNLIAGYRGSLSANYTQGVFPRYDFGSNNFFKNKKISFNINYNYSKDKINRDGDDTVNYLDDTNSLDQSWRSRTNRNTKSETHSLNANFDYFIDDTHTLSFSANTFYLPYFRYSIDNNTIITDENANFLSRFTADNLSRDDKYNLGFDLNFNRRLSKGQLLFNAHFTTYNYERNQGVLSNFYDGNNTFDNASAFNTNANQDTEIFTSKLDYNVPLNDKSSFETGVKYASTRTVSDLTQFDVNLNTGAESLNTLNSDVFDYDERIYAAYANYSLNTDKWSISTGLRVEQTNIEGVSAATSIENIQDYLEWFPNASVQYNLTDNYNVYTNYKRSISRPGYADLNPFRFFLNENYVVSGNPNLVPTFIDHVVVGAGLLNMFTVEAYYKNLDGAISEIPRQDNNTNIIEYINVNFDKTIEFGFDFATYFNVTDRWYLYAVTSFFNLEEETDFGNGVVNQNQWSNLSILQNSISFLEDNSLSATLSLTYYGNHLEAFQTVDERLFSELSVVKSVLDKKGVVSLSVGDIFNAQDIRTRVRYQNQFSFGKSDIDNRYIKVGFRYKFGNTRLETNERSIDLEELKRLDK